MVFIGTRKFCELVIPTRVNLISAVKGLLVNVDWRFLSSTRQMFHVCLYVGLLNVQKMMQYELCINR